MSEVSAKIRKGWGEIGFGIGSDRIRDSEWIIFGCHSLVAQTLPMSQSRWLEKNLKVEAKLITFWRWMKCHNFKSISHSQYGLHKYKWKQVIKLWRWNPTKARLGVKVGERRKVSAFSTSGLIKLHGMEGAILPSMPTTPATSRSMPWTFQATICKGSLPSRSVEKVGILLNITLVICLCITKGWKT